MKKSYRNRKKGSIMILVFMILTICVMFVYVLKNFVNQEMENTSYNMRAITLDDNKNKIEEMAFLKFKSYLIQNQIEINKEAIDNFISNSNLYMPSYIIESGQSMKINRTTKTISIITTNKYGTESTTEYEYDIYNEKLIFKKINYK